MKKLLNLLLILTSLIGYLEWGTGNSTFLFRAEWEVFSKLFTSPTEVIHPFIILPLAEQLMLLITLFQNPPNQILTYLGIAGTGVLLGFMFIIGVMSMNYKIVFSTLPFLVVAFLAVKAHRRTAA